MRNVEISTDHTRGPQVLVRVTLVDEPGEPNLRLSPDEARELAQQLNELADKAEAWSPKIAC